MSRDVKDSFDWAWRRMSPQRKAGCVLWPSLAAETLSPGERALLEEYSPLGLTLFGRNLKSNAQATGFCQDLREVARSARGETAPPLMIAIDEEGGRVSRLPAPFPRTQSARELSLQGPGAVRAQVRSQAAQARELGVNIFFAPVCDLLTEPSNTVIGDRSFGSNPDAVVPFVQASLETLQANGICPVLKHFPGHGGTREDSHASAARVTTDLGTLRSRDWEVFRQCFVSSHCPPAVMTCHVILEALDPRWPATLSHAAIEGVLRGELGFDGVVFSDDLRMNAIAEAFDVKREQTVAIASDDLSRLESAHRALDQDSKGDDYLFDSTKRALEVGVDVVLCCRGIEREARVLNLLAGAITHDEVFAECVKIHAQRAWTLAMEWAPSGPR